MNDVTHGSTGDDVAPEGLAGVAREVEAGEGPMSGGSTGEDPAGSGGGAADVIGVVLAAGAGRRLGRPKALVRDAQGRGLLERALEALRDGGCDDVVVVLGARADEVDVPSGRDVHVCVAPDWADGMGASLRAGLRMCDEIAASRDWSEKPGAATELAVITLVDLPDVDAAVVRRVREAAAAGAPGQARDALVRACYAGRPGHPVVLGRAWWTRAGTVAVGDAGARALFTGHDHVLVECGDLASGRDVDTPDDLARAVDRSGARDA